MTSSRLWRDHPRTVAWVIVSAVFLIVRAASVTELVVAAVALAAVGELSREMKP